MKQLADYQVNDQLPVWKWQPEELQLRQYAEASGDFNPIHLDDDYARKAGLGGVIVHGMLTMAQLGAMLQEWIGNKGMLYEFSVRFKHMVRPGEQVICSGQVKDKKPGSLICDLWVTNVQQQKVLVGSAVVNFNKR